MVYLKWVLLMAPSFFMAVVGRLLAPFLPFFVDETGYLPKWLWWFQTPDNPIDGDRGHWKRWPGTTSLRTYIRRVAWLLRNVCYGFDESVCGVHMLPTDVLTEIGETNASDKKGISGSCWRTLHRDGKLIAFHWYYVKHYQWWHIKACVRISLGWKLWNPETIDKQYTAYFHPCKCLEWRV